MSETSYLPELAVNHISYEKDIKSLMLIVKPTWDQIQLKIKRIYGGYSCYTYHVSLEEQPENAVVVRIRKVFADVTSLLNNVELELEVIKTISEMKLCAVFKTGYCYEYIPGEVFSNFSEPTDIKLEDLPLSLIAEKLAKLHSYKLKGQEYTKQTYFDNILKLCENEYTELTDLVGVSKDAVLTELKDLIEHTKAYDFSVVQCHGDLRGANFVWDKENGKVTLIDWEFTHIGFQPIDLAYFINMNWLSRIAPLPGLPILPEDGGESLKKEFLIAYLESWTKLESNSSTVSDEQINKLYKEVSFCTLWWCLYMAVIGGVTMGLARNQETSLPSSVNIKLLQRKIFAYYMKIKEEKLQEFIG